MSASLFFKYIGWQLAAMLILLFAGFGMEGRDGAFAVAFGCGIAILPNAYFTLQAFRYKASEQPVKALGAMYRGETGKIVLVMVLCALAFRFFEFHKPLLLFMALIVMHMTQILISLKVFPMLGSSGKKLRNEAQD